MSDWRGIDVEVKAYDVVMGDIVIVEATAEFRGYLGDSWEIGRVFIDFGSGDEEVGGIWRDAVLKSITHERIEDAFLEAEE